MNEKEKNVSRRSVRKNTKSTKQNKKPRKLGNFSAAIISIIAICLICATVACTYVLKFANDYVNGEKKIDLDEYKANQAQTSIIYGYDENKELVELLRLHGAENRVWIDYEDIPQDMIDAFRDLEDKRFEEHQGVDWTRTVLGVVKSGFKEGGSTITQQLIKNLTKQNGRTVSRKFYEILNALNLERFYHKKTIMEFYLNTVYLGNGCYGIRTAAEKYFGKNVEDLNAAECAVIASITKAPADYDPLTHLDDNIPRQQYTLGCMLEQGSITKKEYDEAMDFELIFTNSENYQGSQVTKDEDDEKEYTEEDIKFTDKTDSEQSSYYVEYVIDSVIRDLQKEYDLTYNEAWKKVFFGGLRIYAAVDLEAQKKLENVYVNRITFPEEEDTKENPAVQSAMTIMDYSGRVIAMVGGAGEKDTFRGLNRASDSPRQPGSSIKPLSVYTPAIEDNIATWSTKVQNYGIRLGSSRWPVNYGGSHGSADNFVTVQSAL
ncbi:MAG: penicillin-binding protein, partial [Clostridia bacterium]|nr:penicillin-binding protein [Clostridia bacterium]